MEHRQNRLSRLGPFLERGLRYAAQTLAGREGGAWPTSVSRRGASIPGSARHRGVPTR
jgi:hypothetical protein